jgi:hypothetical protein
VKDGGFSLFSGTPIGSWLIKRFGFAMQNECGVAGYSANWVTFAVAACWMPLVLIPITLAKNEYLKNRNN